MRRSAVKVRRVMEREIEGEKGKLGIMKPLCSLQVWNTSELLNIARVGQPALPFQPIQLIIENRTTVT